MSAPAPGLIGEHSASLDPEGRLLMPTALRDVLNVRHPDFELMANLEPDGSICLREKHLWAAHVTDLRARPRISGDSARALLLFASGSAAAKCDKGGRVRVPDALLRAAGIDRADKEGREVVVVGNFEELRLWNPARWTAFRAQAFASYQLGIDELLSLPGDTTAD